MLPVRGARSLFVAGRGSSRSLRSAVVYGQLDSCCCIAGIEVYHHQDLSGRSRLSTERRCRICGSLTLLRGLQWTIFLGDTVVILLLRP